MGTGLVSLLGEMGAGPQYDERPVGVRANPPRTSPAPGRETEQYRGTVPRARGAPAEARRCAGSGPPQAHRSWGLGSIRHLSLLLCVSARHYGESGILVEWVK